MEAGPRAAAMAASMAGDRHGSGLAAMVEGSSDPPVPRR